MIKVKSWDELPEVLEPGVLYDVDCFIIRPRVRLPREDAKEIVEGIEEMAEKEMRK